MRGVGDLFYFKYGIVSHVFDKHQGPVVQSIFSLTSPLRGQLDFKTENTLPDQSCQYAHFHNKTSIISSNKTIKETCLFS